MRRDKRSQCWPLNAHKPGLTMRESNVETEYGSTCRHMCGAAGDCGGVG